MMSRGLRWSWRELTLPGAVILMVMVGWVSLAMQRRTLVKIAIAGYQETELEIVRAMARSVDYYVRHQVKEHNRHNVTEFEQEIFAQFIAPVRLLEHGDAWIYAPDHVVFDLSSDFPDEYRGKSMAQIFEIQKVHGASHYEDMVDAVMNAREGVGWYVWLPEKGAEIAAWTPVRVGDYVWTIGLSTPLPEILESTGAATQMRNSFAVMSGGTVVALAMLAAWGYNTLMRKRAEEIARAQRDLGLALGAAKSTEEVLRLCVEGAMYVSGMDCGGIYLVDESTGALDLVFHVGLPERFIRLASHYDPDSPNAQLVLSGKPAYSLYEQLQIHPRLLDDDEPLRATAIIPVLHHNRVIGCLNVASRTRSTVPMLARGALEAIASRIGSVIARVKAEDALRESEARYRALVENAPLGVIAMDSNGQVVTVNREMLSILGIDGDRAAEAVALLSRPQADKAGLVGDINRCLESGMPVRSECLYINEHGEEAYLRYYLAPTLDTDGRVIGVQAIVEDVTDYKCAETELERLLTDLQRHSIQLQVAVQVSKSASTILDPEKLMRQAVELIREQFGFYYVGLFLVDDVEQPRWATLRAGTGDAGCKMLAAGHRLAVGGTSMIGWCVANAQPRIALDVGQDAVHFDNPHLPDTRSEMALPLISRGQVIGALTVQSEREAAFSEDDVAILQVMAEQLAIALQNASLYEAAQQEIAERRQVEELLAYLNRRLSMLLDVASGVDATVEEGGIAEQLVRALVSRVEYDMVALFTLEDGTLKMRWWACSECDERDLREFFTIPIEQGVTGRVARSGRPAFVRDVHQDPDYVGPSDIFSEICCPLFDGHGVVGVLDVESRRLLSDADFTIVQAAARLAEAAMINARLYEQVRRQAAELEERVVERTAELVALNRELESFSYSVSHDLRAPLRSIDGFSRALLEDYYERLDDTGRDYLRRVRAASQRMGRLIDDLLTLSRVTRRELHRGRVNLSRIASAIADELRESDPERDVEFIIEPELVAYGDAHLLRVVLENLLGNAWKFTSRHPKARIEFGAIYQPDGATVYFVRDDGAGFDMAYADKLFGPFQRLHAMTEFEGNGIGLATVKRIINRHRGHIWAEGAVEQGATFYFTIGDRIN